MKDKIVLDHPGGHTSFYVYGDHSRLGGMAMTKLTATERVAIIADKNVLPAFGSAIAASFPPKDEIAYDIFQAPPGEACKTIETLAEALQWCLDANLGRGDYLITLGGGTVCDLGGLVASLVKRGVRLVHNPTTLLSMVDAAIGGKTGINTKHGKNTLGTFYQPLEVHCAVRRLNSLPDEEFRSGYAEMVKHAVISSDIMVQRLEDNFDAFFAKDEETLIEGIRDSIKIKVNIVQEDIHEAGPRMLLNLGHTFGHGFEVLGGFEKFRHGEAVSLGIIMAFHLGEFLGKSKKEDRLRLEKLLQRAGLPTDFRTVGFEINKKAFIEAMARDKKRYERKINFIVPHALGKVEIHPMTDDHLDEFLSSVGF